MEDRKVKGTMVLDMVRIIRANKDLPWDEHFRFSMIIREGLDFRAK